MQTKVKNKMKELIPVLSEKEKQEIFAYYSVYEKYVYEISEKGTKELKEHPVFGKLISGIPKEIAAERSKFSRELQKDAIINNNWLPYIEYQTVQGVTYAKMGLDFKAWYEVVVLAKNHIVPYLHKEYGNGMELVSSLTGMNRFMDIAMGIIGEAYLQEKEEIIIEDTKKIKALNDELEQTVKEITDYKYALDESSIIAITDQKGIIKNVNNNFCTISKYSREELIGQDHRIINSGYHSKEFIRNIWTTIANGKIWQGELKNKAKDGTIYWVDTTIVPFLDSEHKPFQYIAIRSDITERKNTELKIKKLHEELEQKVNDRTADLERNILQLNEFKHFFNNSNDFSCIANKEGYFEILNPIFEKVLGYSRNELTENPFLDFVHPDDIDSTLREYEKLKSGALVINFVNRYRKNDGSYLYFDWNATPNPATGKLYCIARDITARKAAEDQLLSVNKELEAFSYSVSHDLRAPLRAVNGYAQMLNEDFGTKLDEEGKRIIENISYNAAKMGTLIDDLLTFSRLGRKDVQKSLIDMNELTEGVLIEMDKADSHSAKINIGKLHTVQADYGLLNQVMFNLISNAVKYSSKKKEPVVEIFSEEKNGEIIFSVKDNGAGFNMKYYDKLFGVFQRLHSQEEFEGTGVGLAIVQRIIAKHEGRIWAEGKVNEGATFNFAIK